MTKLANARYLTGFRGSNATVLVGSETVFFTDGRYTEQSRHEVPDLMRVATMDDLAGAIAEHVRRLGIRRLGFERHVVTVAQLERWGGLRRGRAGRRGRRGGALRWAKDAEELALLRAAQEATDRAFDDVLDLLVIGTTERQTAAALELAMKRHGADGCPSTRSWRSASTRPSPTTGPAIAASRRAT